MSLDYLVLFGLFLSFVAGFITAFVWKWQLRRSALSIVRTQANAKGRNAQMEQDGDLMAMLMEVGEAFKAAKASGKDMKTAAGEILPGVISKYPLVSMKYGKKLFKMFKDTGGIAGLEDLF